ncbi:DNA polymerase III subunit epsilon [Stieleria sp. JC731]|uniref:exonuclease domain-containing protein n=1 Tax=Pirellulaceae TaxID=2691357 RepID=UPI001E4ACA3E|nr:exonuclease domain-containing protein [Stieleria sp. JC731]MCC9603180.1 DNA polymerase III subunit epsilon [Stieleria sp. JC731]
MSFRANFTAIDFETANRRQDSACQLAAVVVRDGQIVRERMWMIRPQPFFFSAINIGIHGIRPGDVEHEPDFGEHWADISEFVGDDCLIAHNAMFDVGVLKACLERHECEIPSLSFSCTRLIARQAWPDRQRFGLKPLSNWLGVEFRHHDALEDSRACAQVLLAAGVSSGAESLDDLEKRLRISRGKFGNWGIKNAKRIDGRRSGSTKSSPKRALPKGIASRQLRRGTVRPLRFPANPFDEQAMMRESSPDYQSPSNRSSGQSPKASSGDVAGSVSSSAAVPAAFDHVDWQRVAIRCEFIQPLRGRQVFFVGELQSMSQTQAKELTKRAGGELHDQQSETVNCVIVGRTSTFDRSGHQGEIEILSEDDFLKRLGV